MDVKDVVKEVAGLLQLSNILNLDFEDNVEMAAIDSTTQRDIDLIVKCLNLVLHRIATEYVELLKRDTVSVVNGMFDLTTLGEKIYKVKKVVGCEKYRVVDNKLFAENGNYEIVYSYFPEELDFDDQLEYFENLSHFAIYYGICSEFLMILGDFSQSEIWESKFENSMEMAKSNLKVVDIKHKRWR